MENDAKYYARRAEEERLAADKSEHLVVRQRHLEMAEAYDVRVRSHDVCRREEYFYVTRAIEVFRVLAVLILAFVR